MAEVDPDALRVGENEPVETPIESKFIVILAWLLLPLSFAAFAAGVLLLLPVPENMRGSFDYGYSLRIGVIFLAYSILGALIAARHPKNSIGWILCALGLSWELHVLGVGYLAYAHFYFPNLIPPLPLNILLLIKLWINLYPLGIIGILTFPDGRLLSPRWRLLAWLSVGLGALYYLVSSQPPVAGLPPSQFRPLIHLIFGNISLGFLAISTMAIEVLFGVLYVIAAIGIVLRLRRANGEQQEQLKWLVYAITLTAAIFFGLSVLYYLPIRRELDPGVLGWGLQFLGIPNDLAVGVIPVAIFFAIFKFHLYDINLIINRTLVYVPLTAILAGLYSASVTLFQKLFIASTGQKSDAAVVLSTLVLAATFTPMKSGLQKSVDRRFKEPRDPLKEIKVLSSQIETVAEVINTRRIMVRLLDMAISAFHAGCGAVYLDQGGELVLVHASAGWEDGCGVLSLPMEQDGARLGMMLLGARDDHKSYPIEDCEMLQQAVDRVAEMIWLIRVPPEAE